MSFKGSRPCVICGRTFKDSWYPNKSAICRHCRPQWEKAHPDRHWDSKKKCWIIKTKKPEGSKPRGDRWYADVMEAWAKKNATKPEGSP